MSIPRKVDINRQTVAERAIRHAMAEVEAMGADELLTDAVILLDQAFDKCAEYTDAQIARSAGIQSEVNKATGNG
jgi:hypothetical protein